MHPPLRGTVVKVAVVVWVTSPSVAEMVKGYVPDAVVPAVSTVKDEVGAAALIAVGEKVAVAPGGSPSVTLRVTPLT